MPVATASPTPEPTVEPTAPPATVVPKRAPIDSTSAIGLWSSRITSTQTFTGVVDLVHGPVGFDLRNTNLALVSEALEAIPPGEWDSVRILADVKALAEAQGAKLGDLMQPVRVVLTGSTVSEPVNDLLVVIGRDESLRRIRG